jgi:NOL1/NOP2/sun family putative RNA methylase
MGVRMTLPKQFEDRMRELLGEEFEEYTACFEKKHYSGLRVNTLKITPEEFEKISPFEIKRIPWIENGYYFDEKDQPAKHPYYYAGLYYIQEPSAMTPASLLPVNPGDKVLDLCAAPGGKSTELAARLKGEGVLIANDISNSRAKALLKNIELFGVKNPIIVSEAPGKLVNYFEGYFDKILVDAPCSGEGMFRKSPAIMKNWEQYGVGYYNKLQKEIILSAAKMLKPGGSMLYSTCTFSPEENEGTIAFLLEQCPEFHVVNPLEGKDKDKISYEGFSFGRPEWVNGPEELKNCIRLWPHRIQGEGHFITLLRKDGIEEGQDYFTENKEKITLSDEAVEFIHKIGLNVEFKNISLREDKLYLMPKGIPALKGLRIMRMGLFLGEMKKNRFEPSQALASALKREEYDQVLDLTAADSNTIKYLKGETIDIKGENQEGLNLLCVDGHPLGWGKLSAGVLKNKYLPGWRWM